MPGDFACVAGVFAKSDEIVGVHARCVNAPWKWACALIRGGGANARGNGTMDLRVARMPQTQCRSTRGSSS